MHDRQQICRCGHRSYDHIGLTHACNEGRRRCRCERFIECVHAETQPFGDRRQCTVCRHFVDVPA